MHKGSLFSTPLSALVISHFFDNSHSQRREMVFYCGFDLHFTHDEWYWTFSRVPVGHTYIFGKMYLLLILKIKDFGVFVCFAIELYEFFIYLGYKLLIRYMICKYFLPFSRFFILLMASFVVQKLWVWCSLFCLFLLLFPSLLVSNPKKKSLPRSVSRRLVPMFSSRNFQILHSNL